MSRLCKLGVPVLIGLGIFALPTTSLAVTSPNGNGTAECSFHRGVTTCVSVTERTESLERVVTSGCLAGPTGVPGVRRTTFLDLYTITEVTETASHGRRGREFAATTSSTRVLTSSTVISSACEPISAG